MSGTAGQDKTIIFTDSLSVIKSIKKNSFKSNWDTIIKIRNALISNHNLLKIHWLPSQLSIIDNEKADIAAKFPSYANIITNITLEKNDIRQHIRNQVKNKFKQKPLTHYHYSIINPQKCIPIYPIDIGKEKIEIFSRLREWLGPFLFFFFFCHKWLLKKPTHAPTCTRCNSSLTIGHILTECPLFSYIRLKLFDNTSAMDLASHTTHLMCVNFIRDRLDLQFNVVSE